MRLDAARNSSFEIRLGIMLVRISRPTTEMMTANRARHSVQVLLAYVAHSIPSPATAPNSSTNAADAFIAKGRPTVVWCVAAISSEATTPKLAQVVTCVEMGEGGRDGGAAPGEFCLG